MSATKSAVPQLLPKIATGIPGFDEFLLTHAFLADMLGVRRVGVTEAASALQQCGLITHSRGKIRILDRKGLKAASCACYEIFKDMYEGAQAN